MSVASVFCWNLFSQKIRERQHENANCAADFKNQNWNIANRETVSIYLLAAATEFNIRYIQH